jgi:hypothetical protein
MPNIVCGTPLFEAQVRKALPFWPKDRRYSLKYAEFQPDGHLLTSSQ